MVGAQVERLIVTGGSLADSAEALALCRQYSAIPTDKTAATARGGNEAQGVIARLYCTVGVHPTRCGEFAASPHGDATAHLEALWALVQDGMGTGHVVRTSFL